MTTGATSPAATAAAAPGAQARVAGVGLGRWCTELVDASPDGMLATDDDGLIIFANPRMSALSGYAVDELIGRPVELLVPDDVRAHHDGLHREFRRAPRARTMGDHSTIRLRRRDDTLLPVEIGLAPMPRRSRIVTMATVRDITDRVAMEAERDRLLAVLDLVPDAITIVDPETLRIEYANDAVARLSGFSREELAGTRPHQLSVDRTETDRRAMVARIMAGEEPDQVIEQVRSTRMSEPLPLEFRRRLVTDGSGVQHVVSVARDVSQRLADESRLRASETAFRTTFERAPIGVEMIALKPDGSRTIVMANEALAEMFDCSVSDLVGQSLAEFTYPEDRAADHAVSIALASGESHELSSLHRYRRPDGSGIWVEARSTRFDLPDRPEPMALVHLVDVTGRVREEHRRARRAALNECVAEITTAVLAGEPLSAVLERMVGCACRLVGADSAAISAAESDPGPTRVEAVHGQLLEPLRRVTTPVAMTPAAAQLKAGPVFLLAGPPSALGEPLASTVGPIVGCRFAPLTDGGTGYLTVAREAGAEPFSGEDATDLTRLTSHAQLALHLARARADQHRLALLEDRQRIARDLHDGVTQDLIALGMELAADADDPLEHDQRRAEQVARLTRAVQEIRRVVFELSVPRGDRPSESIRGLVRTAARILGHEPVVQLDPGVDTLPVDLTDDLLHVIREALSNVARHAHATRTSVSLRIMTETIVLEVEDDGTGPAAGSPSHGHGVVNLTERAAARGGRLTIERAPAGGTLLTWVCLRPPLAGGVSPAR